MINNISSNNNSNDNLETINDDEKQRQNLQQRVRVLSYDSLLAASEQYA